MTAFDTPSIQFLTESALSLQGLSQFVPGIAAIREAAIRHLGCNDVVAWLRTDFLPQSSARLQNLALLPARLAALAENENLTQITLDEQDDFPAPPIQIPPSTTTITAYPIRHERMGLIGVIAYCLDSPANAPLHPIFSNLAAQLGMVAARQREHEAQELDAKTYQAVLNAISDTIFITTEDGRFTFICDNIQTIFGYHREEVEAMGTVEKFLGAFVIAPSTLDNTAEIENIRYQVKDKFGRKHVLFINIKRVEIGAGRLLYACRDITAFDRVSRNLHQRERQWESLVEHSPDFIILIDDEYRIQYINHMENNMALTGTLLIDMLPATSRTVALAALDHVFTEAKPTTYEVYGPSPIGMGWYLTTVGPILGEDGSVVGATLISTDVTETRSMAEALRESEARYRRIIEDIPDGIVVIIDGIIKFANPAFFAFVGAEHENDVIDQSLKRFFAPDDAARLKLLFEGSVRPLSEGGTEITLVGFHGKKQAVACTGSRVRFGGELAIQLSLHDISAQREAEALYRNQLQYSEAISRTASRLLNDTLELEAIFDRTLPEIQALVNCDAVTITLIADEVAQVVSSRGYEHHTDVNLIDNIIIPLEGAPNLQTMIQTRQPFIIYDTHDFPGWLQMPQVEWVRSNIGVPIVVNEQAIGFLHLDSEKPYAFGEDDGITLLAFARLFANAIRNAQLHGEVRAQNALLETRVKNRTARLAETVDRIEAILNTINDAIILLDPTGNTQQTNPAFDALFGYPQDAFFGHHISELLIERDRDKVYRTLRNRHTIANDPLFSGEVTVLTHYGYPLPVELILSTVKDDTDPNVLRGIVGIVRDISHHKQIQESLREALIRERELNKMKTRFVSMAIHDFRTPLANILSTTDILLNYQDRISPTETSQRLLKIQDQVLNMNTLLEDVLTIGRAQDGTQNLKIEAIDVPTFTQAIIHNVAESDPQRHHVHYNHNGQEDSLMADRNLYQKIVMNLLTNALKYAPDAPDIYVQTACTASLFILTVRDQGIGIPEDDQPLLFEAFHRAQNVENIKGTGLGLAIVKSAVEAHDGDITFESNPGQGTTFIITLPRTPEQS